MSHQVDIAHLGEVVSRLEQFANLIDERLGTLEFRVQALGESWLGDAAVSHSDAHQRWQVSARQMHSALLALREAAATAHGNYRAAVSTNNEMWQ